MHFFSPSSTRMRRFVREPIRRKRSQKSLVPASSRWVAVCFAMTIVLLLILEWGLWSFSGQHFHFNVPAQNGESQWKTKGKEDPLAHSAKRSTKKPITQRHQYTPGQWEQCPEFRTEDARIYEWCHDDSLAFRFYNPSSFSRYVCRNVRLAANDSWNTTTNLEEDCSPKSARLFRQPAEEEDASGQPKVDVAVEDPISVHFNDGTPPRDLFPDCDVPCLYDGGPRSNNDVRTIDSIDGGPGWKVIFSMEGPKYYPDLFVKPDKWREHQFWATTSYQSEVPLPYYSKAEYNIWHNNFVPFDQGIKAAVFLARNCASMNRREQIVRDLIASPSIRVDALSSCLHNADPPPQVGRDLSNKIHVMKQYLFYLAFENQCVDDYITEKLWGPLEAGVIPVYYGAPNVKDHVPNHSLILVSDFKTTKELAQHLEKVANDRELYESYHAWRKEPPPLHFRAHYDMTDTHSTCRMCRWAYARMHGLGWNHTSQTLRPLLGDIGSRAACLSNEQLVQHPFVESWKSNTGQDVVVSPVSSASSFLSKWADFSSVKNGCPKPLNDGNRMVDLDSSSWRRTVYNRDGFVDFVIEAKAGIAPKQLRPLRLQLITLLKAPITFRKIRDGVWHLQSDISRYTVLVVPSDTASDVVVQQGAGKSIVEILVSASMRLRVLVEDLDTFHKGADEVESYFGKLAADDFFTPIEVSVLVPDGGV